MATSLRLGSIVWAEIADSNGILKLRPAIVVSPTDQITDDSIVYVVAVTSRLVEPLADDHLLLPWHPKGHPRTGLNRRCAAVCSWMAAINSSDIRDVGGIAPGPILLEILRRVAARPRQKPPKDENAS